MTRILLPASLATTGMLFLIFFPDTAFSQSSTFLDPGGQIAVDQRSHLILVTALIMIAITPVFVLLPLILIKYRRGGNSADYKPNWEYSLFLEILMWGIPIILVAIMSWYLWQSTHKLDPYRPIAHENPAIKIQVVGLNWKWLFIYPDHGIATVGEMAIPAQHPVAMRLTSDTVMQSFIISALAGQINVMAGMTTQLHLMADEAGEFQGENMLYSGNGFVEQKFKAIAMAPDAFETWVQNVRSKGVKLDQQAYDILSVQGNTAKAHAMLASDTTPEGVVYFTLPDTELFRKIVMRYHSGAPLALDEQPGSVAFSATINKEAAQ